MSNPILKQLNFATGREFARAALIWLCVVSVTGCGGNTMTVQNVPVDIDTSRDFEFALVHQQDSTSDGRRTLLLHSSKGTLEITYFDGFVVTRTSTVKVGMQPVSVRAASNKEAWVVDPIADSISIVDLDSATVTATLHTAPQPTDVVFSGSPLRAYVTVAQGRELLVFDPAAPAAPPMRIAQQYSSLRNAADEI